MWNELGAGTAKSLVSLRMVEAGNEDTRRAVGMEEGGGEGEGDEMGLEDDDELDELVDHDANDEVRPRLRC